MYIHTYIQAPPPAESFRMIVQTFNYLVHGENSFLKAFYPNQFDGYQTVLSAIKPSSSVDSFSFPVSAVCTIFLIRGSGRTS